MGVILETANGLQLICQDRMKPFANPPASGNTTAPIPTDLERMLGDDRPRVGSGRGTTRAEDAQGTPTQSHISPSILVYEEQLAHVLCTTSFSALQTKILRRLREGQQQIRGGLAFEAHRLCVSLHSRLSSN